MLFSAILRIMATLDYLIVVDLEPICDNQNETNRQKMVEWTRVVYDVARRCALDYKQIFVGTYGAATRTRHRPPCADSGSILRSQTTARCLLHSSTRTCTTRSQRIQSRSAVSQTAIRDLKHLLLSEAAPHFRAFFNLRAEFTARYPAGGDQRDRHAKLAALDINFILSSLGIGHCVAIADIASIMLYDGHVFSTPFVTPEYDRSDALTRVLAVAAPIAAAVPVGGIVRLIRRRSCHCGYRCPRWACGNSLGTKRTR